MPDPYIISVGLSPIGSSALPGRDLFSLALAEAVDQLPEPASFIEAMYVGNQSERYENQIMHGTLLAEWAGLRSIPAERVEGCAAAGALALRHAVRDVRAGIHGAVLACGVEQMSATGVPGATDALASAFERALEQRSGVTAPSQYALLAHRYLHETNATEQDLAQIAVKNHRNAAKNPRAHFQQEIDIDTVLRSDYIAPPIKLYDCAPISDGAAVAIVTTKEIAESLVPKDCLVRVTGEAATVNNLAVAERNLTVIEGAQTAVARAYSAAGITPQDIDVAEVHDAFTVCEALLVEAAEFCAWGDGIESGLDPAYRSDTWCDVHVNTSGGLKARGHPIGATGIAQAVEVYEQLTNRAGKRQVPDANTGLLINEGGVADAVTVAHILTSAS